MTTLYTTLAIIGLILAGSDGPNFPQLNLVGVAIFAAGIYLANRQNERSTNVHL